MNVAVRDAVIEAKVDEIMARKREPGFSVFVTGDTEIDGAMAEPARMTSTAEDRVVIYHTETGEPREILVNMLRKTLGKRLPDGRPAFSMEPTREWKLGTFMCELHPEHPHRATWDRAGLEGVICNSGHLASAFHVRRHMENKHSDEAKVIAEYRAQAEQAEWKRLQQEQTAAMLALLERQAMGTPPTSAPDSSVRSTYRPGPEDEDEMIPPATGRGPRRGA